MKHLVKRNICDLGLDFDRIIHFLKVESKIDLGFEAQLIGIGARSATTTGLITYVLGLIVKLTDNERSQYLEEVHQFKITDGYSDVYGTNKPCS